MEEKKSVLMKHKLRCRNISDMSTCEANPTKLGQKKKFRIGGGCKSYQKPITTGAGVSLPGRSK